MLQLNSMGYSREDLFPDIDKIAKAVQDQVLGKK